MSGRKGMGHHSVATKEEAVRLFLEERMTYHAIAKRLGIRKAERIEAWVRAYRREGELGLHNQKADRTRNKIRLPILPGWRWTPSVHC
jgi:transposase-like protein